MNLLTFMMRSLKAERCDFFFFWGGGGGIAPARWNPFKTRIPPLSFYYKEQSTANSNSFKIAQKAAFEAKRRLYTTGKVIQRLFILDLHRELAIYGYR